jgi:voltage-gated potassium channel
MQGSRALSLSGSLKRLLEIAVLGGALATIPLTVALEEHPGVSWIQTTDWAIWAIFVLEFAVGIATTRARLEYVRQNPLNLAVIVFSFPLLPVLLGLVRVVRAVRFLRLFRLAGVAARSMIELRTVLARRGLLYVASGAFVLVLAGGAGLALLEPQTVRGEMLNGIFWALYTVTTVGYSEVTPATMWGRLIGVVLMITSVGLISSLAASITASFLGKEEGVEIKELRKQTTRLEGLLQELLARRQGVAEQMNGQTHADRDTSLPESLPDGAAGETGHRGRDVPG